MIKYLFISTTLHALLFLSLAKNKPNDKQEQGQPPPKQEIQIKIKDKEIEDPVAQSPLSNLECADYYTGIGIIVTTICEEWCHLDRVIEGGPAYRAGLRAGQLIYCEGGDCPGRGPLGEPVTVSYKLDINAAPITVDIIREKICSLR
jgi:hypothetical protein